MVRLEVTEQKVRNKEQESKFILLLKEVKVILQQESLRAVLIERSGKKNSQE